MTQANKERAAKLRQIAAGIRKNAKSSAKFSDRYLSEVSKELSRAQALEAQADALDPPPSLKAAPSNPQRIRPRSLDRALLRIAQKFGKKNEKAMVGQ